MQQDELSQEQLLQELKKLQNERLDLQERLDRISEISAAIIYMLDVEGRFTFVNRAVEDILNYRPEELIGKHFSTIMSQEEYERVARKLVLPKIAGTKTGALDSPKLFDERRTGERRTKHLEVKLLTKDKENVRIMVGDVTGIIAVEGAYDTKKVKGATNKAAGFLGSQGVIFDITRYKKAEKERMELQKRLFEMQKMDAIGKLAGKVAHDLNNKLGSIIGCAEVLRQDVVSDENLVLYVDTILSASKHASELSNRLMEFSGKDSHHAIELDLQETVGNVIELLRHTVDSSISIARHFLDQSVLINSNPYMLQNAILNVASNAIDAMAQTGGQLTFDIRLADVDCHMILPSSFIINPGTYVILSIVDTGIGMEESVRARLFEPFFTTKPVGKGIGLGLASVRDCMRSHNGFVEVYSEPGKGSKFELYFPYSPSK
jgi:PAS domain S-box-containing protein